MSSFLQHSKKPYGVTDPKDDMELIYSSLEKMNALVFGTPFYYGHVSARSKIFVDRLICYEHGSKRDRFPKNVPSVIIIAYEWEKPEAYSSVVAWMKNTLERYFKMKVIAVMQAENTVRNPVANREDLLDETRQLGRNL